MKILLAMVLWCGGVAVAQTDRSHGSGAVMPDDSQMFWDDSNGQFISAPAFIFNDIHSRSANRFIASSKLPSTDFALEGDGFRWLSRQGGCEMQFHQGRWQARGAVQSWHPDLINYGPCRELLTKLRSISPETEP